jgi:hypothetical protein
MPRTMPRMSRMPRTMPRMSRMPRCLAVSAAPHDWLHDCFCIETLYVHVRHLLEQSFNNSKSLLIRRVDT